MGVLGKSWESIFWESVLALTCAGAIAFAIFVFTLPSPYNPYRADLIEEENFSESDKKKTESGYGYFAKHRGTDKFLRAETSVTVLVLGDIGRSPRMQYHVASIAKHGGKVSLVGYVESEILPEVRASRFVKIIPLKPISERLRTSSTLMFPIIAPLKVIFQIWSVWMACGYKTKPTKWMLVQNPPSIPTLLIAQFVCFIRNTRLIIDWHNFGYTILALKLGQNHPLVKISEVYEQYVARWASAHFCVTNAMARVLKQQYQIDALPLHDRPAKQFQPLNSTQRSEVLHRLSGTSSHASQIEKKEWRLLVSSTSWTADEDFSILLDALVAYSATVSMDRRYPKILAIITGKGPQKDYYLGQIQKLKDKKRLANVSVKTAWLSLEDYALLLGAADIGVSLHKSSSGVDLPMKVVDMFGTGLPVFGYSKFEAWPELVRDGVNGMGFETADELETLLEKAFTGKGDRLEILRNGASKETNRRWDDEWFPIAGKVFKMSGTTVESEPRKHVEQEKLTYSFQKPQAPAEKAVEPTNGATVSSGYEEVAENDTPAPTIKERITTTLFGDEQAATAQPSEEKTVDNTSTSPSTDENVGTVQSIKEKINTTLFGDDNAATAQSTEERTSNSPSGEESAGTVQSIKDKITTTLFGEEKSDAAAPSTEEKSHIPERDQELPIQRATTPPPTAATPSAVFSHPITSAREEEPQVIAGSEQKTDQPFFPVASTGGQPGGTFLSYR